MNACNAEQQQLVDDCVAREGRLSTWERDFVESVRERLAQGLGLSAAQAAKLDEIWERATARG